MSFLALLLRTMSTVGLAILMLSGVAMADAKTDRDARLAGLFASLKTTTNQAQAHGIAMQIWRTWAISGDAEVDQLMNKAQIAMSVGQNTAAIDILGKVVQAAPDFAEGWNRRATLYYVMGRDQESVADIQKVLALEPRHFGALSGLGLIHMRAGNWKSAIAAIKRGVALYPFLATRNLIPQLEKKLEGQPL